MNDNQLVELQNVDEAQLRDIANELAGLVYPPLVIFLDGPLGAGKTSFARALIQGLGYADRVKSPTYSLLESYTLDGVDVVHLDLYRINDPGELEFLSLDDMAAATICLVEWAENGLSALPDPDMILELDGSGETRDMCFIGKTQKGRTLMESVAWSAYAN